MFHKWTKENAWDPINDRLRALVREAIGKRSRPTASILDSQRVKSDPHGGCVGYDAGKCIKGRKRHILVDTLGLLLGVHVTAASTPERSGAKELLEGLLQGFNWLRILWVDGGYNGKAFADWVKEKRPKLKVEVVKRSDDMEGFEVLPRRWIVERTFFWMAHARKTLGARL